MFGIYLVTISDSYIVPGTGREANISLAIIIWSIVFIFALLLTGMKYKITMEGKGAKESYEMAQRAHTM